MPCATVFFYLCNMTGQTIGGKVVRKGKGDPGWCVNMQHDFCIYEQPVASRLHFLSRRVDGIEPIPMPAHTYAKVNCRAIFVCINNGKFVIHIILIALAKSSQDQMTEKHFQPDSQNPNARKNAPNGSKICAPHNKGGQNLYYLFKKQRMNNKFWFKLNKILKHENIRFLPWHEWMEKYFRNYLTSPPAGMGVHEILAQAFK